MGQRLEPRIQQDHLVRLSKATPLNALEEILHNAFDERPTLIQVTFETTGSIGRVDKIIVTDDGKSLPHEEAKDAFEKIGDSAKVARRAQGESLHGRKGEGRHKVFSLGNRVEWQFTYEKGGELFTYRVEGTAGELRPFYLGDEAPAAVGAKRGCVVTISHIERALPNLMAPNTLERLTSIFAPVLIKPKSACLIYNGTKLDPSAAIESRDNFNVQVYDTSGSHVVEVMVIRWKDNQPMGAFLCGADGIVLYELSDGFAGRDSSASLFLSATLFDELHQNNLLATFENSTDDVRKVQKDKIRNEVRQYFANARKVSNADTLQELKSEGSYPFKREPKTDVEKVERRVFDLCTIHIARKLPQFHNGFDVSGRKFVLQLVKEALSQEPSAVKRIIQEVCRLSTQEAELMAGLLDDVPLSTIVEASHRICKRLEFLKSLRAIVYLDPFQEVIRERVGLQQLVASNTWIFGERYSLGTSDQNIYAILTKHIHHLQRDQLTPPLSEKEIREMLNNRNAANMEEDSDLSFKRIPDLMVHKTFFERNAEFREYLVIELKRPKVKINAEHVEQIEKYARAVTSEGLCKNANYKWTFLLIGDDLHDSIEDRVNQENRASGLLSQPKGKNYSIWVQRWTTILSDAEGRHAHLQKWFDHSVELNTALERTRESFGDLLPELSGVNRNPPTTLPKVKGKRKKRASR